jgi:hypothetical protein
MLFVAIPNGKVDGPTDRRDGGLLLVPVRRTPPPHSTNLLLPRTANAINVYYGQGGQNASASRCLSQIARCVAGRLAADRLNDEPKEHDAALPPVPRMSDERSGELSP